MTDGFCVPKYKPDCGCWVAARAAIQGIMNQADPAFAEAWTISHKAFLEKDKADPRKILDAVCQSILTREDELTKEMAPKP